jgi:hypothetical protein
MKLFLSCSSFGISHSVSISRYATPATVIQLKKNGPYTSSTDNANRKSKLRAVPFVLHEVWVSRHLCADVVATDLGTKIKCGFIAVHQTIRCSLQSFLGGRNKIHNLSSDLKACISCSLSGRTESRFHKIRPTVL